MPACEYEFYLLVFNSISHSFATLTRDISSWTLEDKIHIHGRACNILYILISKEQNEQLILQLTTEVDCVHLLVNTVYNI